MKPFGGITFALLAGLLSGCCLTSQLWGRTERTVDHVMSGSLAADSTLIVSLWLENGEIWEVRVPQALDAQVESEPFVRQVIGAERVPPSVVRVTVLSDGIDTPPDAGTDPIFIRMSDHGDLSYCRRSTQWREIDVDLGRDWWSGATIVAVLLTPATLLVDCLAAPIEVGWLAMSAGGHGRNPIPWCEEMF